MKSLIKIKSKIQSTWKSTLSIGVMLMFVLMSFTVSRDSDDNFETVKNLDIFYTLYKELNLYYVDPIVPGDIIKVGIDAMLQSLDPYTVYIPESQIEDLKFMTTGQYGGIGSLIRQSGDYIMITQPVKDSPADKAGIIPGDIILEIDEHSIKGKPSEEVSELLRGEPNTTVKLKIQRIGNIKPIEVSIVREEIKMNSVPYYGLLEEGIGYIALNSFTNTAAKEVQDAFLDLKKTHNITSLVIDLRGNPGGLLIEAVKICNIFVTKGEEIVSTRGKIAQWDKSYTAYSEPIDTEVKLVVLVDRGSASASEIVSGCIQDLDRGVIVGQRTFGKGLVQTTRELSYNGVLKVTTAKYYIPSGRCIQALDYTNRNEDGSVGHVPDSLITEYKTKNGRKVYDGGGVAPDVDIEIEMYSNIATSLIIKNLVFDYANYYKFTHPTIASPENYVFTDADYDDFVKFLSDKDFDYETKTEETLNQLIESSKNEKYYDQASQELDVLKTKFAHDKNKDLVLFKDEIKDLISQEIVLKYYYETGGIIYGLKHDPEVRKAIEIVKDDTKYHSILLPSGNK
jgi:carboxyl-terminal processing protease